jgi:DNA/RNA-binding domain of Phe-tRNA-synthetase-like protein
MSAPEASKLAVSPAWAAAYPEARVGVLRVTGVRNPESDPALDRLLDETAASLRARHAGETRPDLLARPELAAYAAHYRRFDKTYHVLLQLESVALKDKPLRSRGVLVAAMFRAELETGLLTAGHDGDRLAGGLTADVVVAGDGYTGIGGREIQAAPGDMCIRDGGGIVSSVVYGPDDRTRLSDDSQTAVFTTYAPAGIGPDLLTRHMELIAEGVEVAAPGSAVESMEIVPR